MKRILPFAAALCMLCLLPACNNRADDQSGRVSGGEPLQPMQQSWHGVLPCAECSGVDTSLFLNKDGTWIMTRRYLSMPKQKAAFGSWGSWARTAEKLVLTSSAGEKISFRVKGRQLEMQESHDDNTHSGLNAILEPVRAPLPDLPMTMRGMYAYFADVATFTDCVTGRKIAVSRHPHLQREYTAIEQGGKPVLLLIDGHLTLKANPATGKQEAALVPDSDGKFTAGKGCRD